jgi:hypothetical protein
MYANQGHLYGEGEAIQSHRKHHVITKGSTYGDTHTHTHTNVTEPGAYGEARNFENAT